MKVNHVVKRALKTPKPGKTYGARMGGIRLGTGSITVEWEIFSCKSRAKRSAARRKATKIKDKT